MVFISQTLVTLLAFYTNSDILGHRTSIGPVLALSMKNISVLLNAKQIAILTLNALYILIGELSNNNPNSIIN